MLLIVLTEKWSIQWNDNNNILNLGEESDSPMKKCSEELIRQKE